ncbi:PREDICTED: neuritin-like protein [Aptenodytes forsteri]|uniref:neuritin-like protein n=1 Tax=Aptenodytes forsteri TaxID=9233 RepID=UPI0004F410FF|nr:PREDICTED: neuritin-like protein [Aptenodytes forsteri]
MSGPRARSEAASQEPISMAGKCDTIYQGFAGCLISLGDSMAQSVRRQREEGGEEAEELDTICKPGDDSHACASEVLSSCPEEAAAIWESLRQESRKIQFQGNLQELCSARGHINGSSLARPRGSRQRRQVDLAGTWDTIPLGKGNSTRTIKILRPT